MENSWEPVEHVENTPQIIARFHELHPGAPRQIERTAFAKISHKLSQLHIILIGPMEVI